MKRYRLLWFVVKRTHTDKLLYAFLINIFAVALVITLVEPDISNYGDGLWYTFVACTTIGFGDFAAVTLIGRILTVYMAVNEILLVAIIPGVVVSYYLEVLHRRENETLTMFMDKLEHLPELSHEELQAISDKIKKLK